MSLINDALLRSILVTVSPSNKAELMMLGDAIRIWKMHPELRHELLAKSKVGAEGMLTRVAMALAVIAYAPPDVPDDLEARCTEPGCPGADGDGCIHRSGAV